MLPVAVLAGGLATRLRPVTEQIPKALIKIAGEPFIFHQLRYMREQGIDRVVLCIGYLGERIREVVADGSPFGLNVAYSFDGPVLLGTGGALRQAIPLLGDRWFVLYGDSFLPVAFPPIQQAFLASGQPALMTVLHNRDQWDRSNVIFRDGRILAYDKRPRPEGAEHIDYGLGLLSSDALAAEPADGPFDLADVYRRLAREGRLAGYEVRQRFYEIGSFDGMRETEAYLLERGKT
jgi:N-acetyl-alpha-D-muramate 1-phosphate uridylyltransferase